MGFYIIKVTELNSRDIYNKHKVFVDEKKTERKTTLVYIGMMDWWK